MSTVAAVPPKVLDNSRQLSKEYTQVAFASDLHLDFGNINPEFFEPPADILILAGDIIEARRAHKQYDFWKACSENFAHVLYCPGNHEYYDGALPSAEEKLKAATEVFGNIHVMQNETLVYNDTVFIGSTLWTDMGKSDPVGKVHAPLLMADYKVIRESKNNYRKLRVDTTIIEHLDAVRYIKSELKKHADKNCIVFSHHGPSHLSIHKDYAHDKYGNMNYVSDLSDLMLDHPNLKHWIHGHVHNHFNYKIGECTVHVNPRGYPGERPSHLPPFRPMKFGV